MDRSIGYCCGPVPFFTRMKKPLALAVLSVTIIIAACSAGAADRRTPVVIAVEKVSPAVVNINTSFVEVVNPFRSFNPFFRGGSSRKRKVERRSLGSGVIIRKDGYILTNNHVIDGATAISVTLSDERVFEAQVIGADRRSDLAVIKIESDKDLPFADLGRSDDLMIGETVIAIGNPFGLTHTVTTGVVSAEGRDIKGDDGKLLLDFIQIDASINPGNSGGALLNINGELIGVTTAIYQQAEGIGFAIPIGRAIKIFDALVSHGSVARGWTGMIADGLTRDLRWQLGYKGKGGVVITEIFEGGPAGRAGLMPGDIVTHINGKKIDDIEDFIDRIGTFTDNDTITATVARSGSKPLDISFAPEQITAKLADSIIRDWLGVKVSDKEDKGVVVTWVKKNSELDQIGLRPGDYLIRMNRTDAKTVDDLRKAVTETYLRGGAVLFVQRGQSVYQITIGR